MTTLNNNKMNNNNMNNNKNNGGNGMKNDVYVIGKKEGKSKAKYQIFRNKQLEEAVRTGEINRDEFSKMTAVNMLTAEKEISLMQLNFNSKNDIGPVTKNMTNARIIDVRTEVGFEAFKAAWKPLMTDESEEAPHEEYTTIWVEGYNMFSNFVMEDGTKYTFYVVTNEEITMFYKKLKAMNKFKMTVEEAEAIQADLEPIVRAYQESAIDCHKDTSKVFNLQWKRILNIVETQNTYFKKKEINIDFGFGAIKEAKENNKPLPEFKFNMPGIENIAPDLMSKINWGLVDTVVGFLNGTPLEMYNYSTNERLLAPYVGLAADCPALALYIKQLYKMNADANNEGITITKDQYELMRRSVYTKAVELGVETNHVINIAIAVAMTNVTYNHETNTIKVNEAEIASFKDTALKHIFPREYVVAMSGLETYYEPFNAKAMVKAWDEENDVVVEEGESLVFVDGATEDGTVELFDETFNGVVTNVNGKLMVEIDVFDFEPLQAIIIDKTFKENTDSKAVAAAVKAGNLNSVYDDGEAFAKLLDEEAPGVLTITGKNNNIVGTGKTLFGKTAVVTSLTGKQVIDDILSFMPYNGRQRLFFIVFC